MLGLLMIISPGNTIPNDALANTTLIRALVMDESKVLSRIDRLRQFEDGVLLRPAQVVLGPQTLWLHFDEGSDLVLIYDQKTLPKDFRLYISKYGSPPLAYAWNGFADNLPRPAAVITEPYESATLPLNDGTFLWIRSGFQKRGGSSQRHTVQIDVTSIDRSKLLTTGNSKSHDI